MLSRGHGSLAIPTGTFGVLSPLLTAWLFSWSLASAVSTAIPSFFIVRFAYSRNPGRRAFTSSAFKLAAIAALWLAIAAVYDEVTHLYTREEFWIDFRFYVGWVLGLLLSCLPSFRTDNI